MIPVFKKFKQSYDIRDYRVKNLRLWMLEERRNRADFFVISKDVQRTVTPIL